MKKKAISGIKPTGTLHLGNYFGAMKQFVDLQEKFDLSIFVADLHALISIHDAEEIRKNTINIVRAYIAAGIDPEKVTIFKQSDIPEVTELCWIFNCLTTMPQLMLAHAYKDAQTKKKDINVGLFDYPILMAADILIHNAEFVPVGKDQVQHVEIAREIARKFNKEFKNLFTEPQEHIVKAVETVPGLDGQKMSKSYNNIIPLFGSTEEISKAVMRIPTDSAAISEPKDINGTLFAIHTLFITPEEKANLVEKYQYGNIGYKDAKEACIASIEAYIGPMRDKYNSITDKEVVDVLIAGKEKVRKQIEFQMKEVRSATGLTI